MGMNMCVSASAFSLALFLVCLFCPIPVCFCSILLLFFRCPTRDPKDVDSNEREVEKSLGGVGERKS